MFKTRYSFCSARFGEELAAKLYVSALTSRRYLGFQAGFVLMTIGKIGPTIKNMSEWVYKSHSTFGYWLQQDIKLELLTKLCLIPIRRKEKYTNGRKFLLLSLAGMELKHKHDDLDDIDKLLHKSKEIEEGLLAINNAVTHSDV